MCPPDAGVWPAIDHEFRRNILRIHSALAFWTGDYRVDPQTAMFMMKFIINNRTDEWKTDNSLVFLQSIVS